MMRNIACLVLLIGTGAWCFAQDTDNTIDKVIAVVGEDIILKSDLETQYLRMLSTGYAINENTRCELFEEQLFQALLLHQAKLDSIEVSDAQVEDEMNRRMRYFINQLGSEEKLEEFYKKSIVEIKAELQDLVKEQLLVQTMQQNITTKVKATPAEVRAYFNKIPVDSLPLINSEVEMAQIVKRPYVNEDEKKRVKAELEVWRKRILGGEDFGTFAYLYSHDPGSKDQSGELGMMSRASLVPEFAAAAFNLRPGEISEVVETEFGFHIIQMIERRGDLINVRHLLRKPNVSTSDKLKASNYLDSIAKLITRVDTMDFALAAILFSDDKDTKNNGGLIVNPQTGTGRFEIDQIPQIDPTLFFVVDKLKIGETSQPVPMQTAEGGEAYRIVKLITRTEPHRANLIDDYQRVQEAALAEKQGKTISNWIKKQASKTFIKIDDDFVKCEFQNEWNVAQQN